MADDEHNGHVPRGQRFKKGNLTLKKKNCPECGHHKMFYYESINSHIRRKCTKCSYREWK